MENSRTEQIMEAMEDKIKAVLEECEKRIVSDEIYCPITEQIGIERVGKTIYFQLVNDEILFTISPNLSPQSPRWEAAYSLLSLGVQFPEIESREELEAAANKLHRGMVEIRRATHPSPTDSEDVAELKTAVRQIAKQAFGHEPFQSPAPDENGMLEFGIEIVSAMKASVYGCDIEGGRIMALENTEIDRIVGHNSEDWDSFPEHKKRVRAAMANQEKAALHKQALFVAKAAMDWLNTRAHAPSYTKPAGYSEFQAQITKHYNENNLVMLRVAIDIFLGELVYAIEQERKTMVEKSAKLIEALEEKMDRLGENSIDWNSAFHPVQAVLEEMRDLIAAYKGKEGGA